MSIEKFNPKDVPILKDIPENFHLYCETPGAKDFSEQHLMDFGKRIGYLQRDHKMVYDEIDTAKNNTHIGYIASEPIENYMSYLLTYATGVRIIKSFHSPYEYKEDYDIGLYFKNSLGDNISLLAEIKNDICSASSGNMGIEFWGRGRPSALSLTRCHMWIQIVRDVKKQKIYIILFHRSNVRELCFRSFGVGVGGDDGSKTKMFLLNLRDQRDEIFQLGKNIITIPMYNGSPSVIRAIENCKGLPYYDWHRASYIAALRVKALRNSLY